MKNLEPYSYVNIEDYLKHYCIANKIKRSLGVSIKVSNVNTKKINICSSKREASLDLGVSYSTIERYIKSKKLLCGIFSITRFVVQ